MTTKQKLKCSLYALQEDYRISERWVEHFMELISELEDDDLVGCKVRLKWGEIQGVVEGMCDIEYDIAWESGHTSTAHPRELEVLGKPIKQ